MAYSNFTKRFPEHVLASCICDKKPNVDYRNYKSFIGRNDKASNLLRQSRLFLCVAKFYKRQLRTIKVSGELSKSEKFAY